MIENQENQMAPRPELPADDHLLESLAALTGLFNPEQLWQQEEVLDDLEEKGKQAPAGEPE